MAENMVSKIEKNAKGLVLKDQNYDYIRKKSILLDKNYMGLAQKDLKRLRTIL